MSFFDNIIQKGYRLLIPKQSKTMNLEHISKVVGREITAENVGTLTAEDFEKINQSMVPSPVAAANPEGSDATAVETPEAPVDTNAEGEQSTNQAASASDAMIASITAAVDGAIQSHVQPLVERVAKLENRTPAAPATPTPAVPGTQETQYPWNDPNDPLNKQVAEFFGE